MLRIGICSREKEDNLWLKTTICAEYQVKIFQYASPKDLQRRIGDEEIYLDILIVDFYWKEKSEMEVINAIQKKYDYLKIIFMIEKLDTVAEVFETDAVYVLIKPIQKLNLYRAVDKAIRKIGEMEGDMLQLCYKEHIYRIPIKDILYVESNRRYLTIYTGQRSEKVLMKLSDLQKKLPEEFWRCHQSYIINLNKMKDFMKYQVILFDGSVIPVSRGRYQETRQRILSYYEA